MKKIYFLTGILLLIFSTSAFSQIDIYLKIIDDNGAVIEGESIVKGYEKQIDAASYAQESTSCSVSSTGGGVGSCKTATSNFAFDLILNKAINPLRRVMYRGARLKRIEATFLKNAGSTAPQKYYQIIMEDVVVSKISDYTNGEASNTNQIEFSPAKVGWLYYPQDAKGGTSTAIKFGWDIEANIEWNNF